MASIAGQDDAVAARLKVIAPAETEADTVTAVTAEETDGNAAMVVPVVENLALNDSYADMQWALNYINIASLWQTDGGGGVIVAVLDTGVDSDHEDLSGQVVGAVNFSASEGTEDIHGHGTHIAGIIAANSDNGQGVAGIAPGSRLLNVKVADDNGYCQSSAVAEGIIWAVDNGALVINLSLELKEPTPELEAAVDYAWSRGAIVIAAAGNEGTQTPVYPALYENVIAVAATSQNDTLAPLSNYGQWVNIAAPGNEIYSTLPGDKYGFKTGTSFATAHVSGLAAILFNTVSDSNGDGRLNDEVRAALETGCQQVGGVVEWGRVDAALLALNV
jgi:thermitase